MHVNSEDSSKRQAAVRRRNHDTKLQGTGFCDFAPPASRGRVSPLWVTTGDLKKSYARAAYATTQAQEQAIDLDGR